ncbi:MAG: NFACT family protein [Archaeoglobus sp.]|nr:NFACT family protein [Archaeoglobus sp.]
MKQFSAVDVKAVVNELQNLIDARVDKIYHHPPDEIRIRLRKPGERFDLIIEAGKRMHLTKFPKESPRFPSSFAMLLRKHLEGGKIKSIEQHDFDRIVFIRFEREEEKVLIAEFFKKGNVILCNSELKIIMPLKSFFKPGEVYKLPKPQLSPFDVKAEDFHGEKDVVRFLATNLSIGGQYAEEICLRAGIDKKKRISELSENEIDVLLKAINSIFEPVRRGEFKPHILLKDGDYFDVLPVELKIYENLEKKYFDSFNSALDDFYSKMAVEEAETKERTNKTLEKIKKRLEDQLAAKEKFEKEMERYRTVADFIYENYGKVEEIIETFRKAREKKSWEEIKKIVKENKGLSKLVKRIDPSKNLLVVQLDGFELELFLDKTVPQIADLYYEKAKKAKQKYEGVVKAIRKTEEEMKRASEKVRFESSIRISRKRKWYERFRWFLTSEGFLVIGGRNAKMNEEIVSKYMDKGDLFFHTQVPGAPVTVLKEGEKAGEQSRLEAAQFAASYSSLWKEGKYSGEVYYVTPEQVKRSAKPGEYLPKGSFYIEGKRNYLSVSVSCAVGVDLKNLRVFGGPLNAVRKYCDYFVELDIGNESPNDLSVKIASKLISMAKEDEKHLVRAIATPDEVMKFLPPGKSRIKE